MLHCGFSRGCWLTLPALIELFLEPLTGFVIERRQFRHPGLVVTQLRSIKIYKMRPRERPRVIKKDSTEIG